MTKTYFVSRGNNGVICNVSDGGSVRSLKHIVRHSPTGFGFGYGGSGPADLALSILCDYFDEKPTKKQIYRGEVKAMGFYQEFKWEIIATKQGTHFVVSQNDIERFLAERHFVGEQND